MRVEIKGKIHMSVADAIDDAAVRIRDLEYAITTWDVALVPADWMDPKQTTDEVLADWQRQIDALKVRTSYLESRARSALLPVEIVAGLGSSLDRSAIAYEQSKNLTT